MGRGGQQLSTLLPACYFALLLPSLPLSTSLSSFPLLLPSPPSLPSSPYFSLSLSSFPPSLSPLSSQYAVKLNVLAMIAAGQNDTERHTSHRLPNLERRLLVMATVFV